MELLHPLNRATYPTQTVTFTTGAAGNTAGWPPGAEGVMVWSDQPCYVEVGENATATNASTPIPAYTPIPIKVPIRTSGLWRVSAIGITVGGTLYAKPVNTK